MNANQEIICSLTQIKQFRTLLFTQWLVTIIPIVLLLYTKRDWIKEYEHKSKFYWTDVRFHSLYISSQEFL